MDLRTLFIGIAMHSTQDLRAVVGLVGVIVAGLEFLTPLAFTLPGVWRAGSKGRKWGFPFFLATYTCMLRLFLIMGFEPRADQSPILTQAMIYLFCTGFLSQLICFATFLHFYSDKELAVTFSYMSSGFFMYIALFALYVADLLGQEFLGVICCIFACLTTLSPLVGLLSVIEEGMERMPTVRFLGFAMGNSMVWIWFGWLGDDPLVMRPNVAGFIVSIVLLILHVVFNSEWAMEYMALPHDD